MWQGPECYLLKNEIAVTTKKRDTYQVVNIPFTY
jgi:hypothetical protein